MEFLKVDSVEAAREKLFLSAKDLFASRETHKKYENLPLESARGKILAEDIFAASDIPAFRRSTVDGYAVISGDTAAAGESIPVFLTVKGRVEMGCPAGFSIDHGECAEVPTGGMLPDGADAVVMVEYAEPFGAGVALYSGAANGENVAQTGEDAREGALLLRRGRRLLPQDIGALAAAGVTKIPVHAPLRLTILSTGDELVPPSREPLPGQVRDVNTYALTALAEKTGFFIEGSATLPDDADALEKALRGAMKTSDIVAVSGGSSKGKKDMTGEIIGRVSTPGVFTHGMAIKPGKPTILGCDKNSGTLLAGLPGHPVSAMMVFELLFGWLLREITGSAAALPVPARLSCNVASSPGKLTCWPVRLVKDGLAQDRLAKDRLAQNRLAWGGEFYSAEPIFGKSGLITTLTGADGYFTVDRSAEGLQAGQTVLVNLF